MIQNSQFSPGWWLRNPHLQTIWASKVRKPAPLALTSERLELPDGDFVDLLWSAPTPGPVVCLFHGLAGSINSVYINRMFAALQHYGANVVLMHFRGCSGVPNRLAKSYHSGHTDDIRFLVKTAVQRFPQSSVQAVGFSLGGNALLKYLGEEGKACALSAAYAVSPPLVLKEGAMRMQSGLSRIYQRYLLGLMRQQHEAKRQTYPHLDLPEAGPDLDNFWRFDDALTAPLNGFKDVHDYYEQCSSRQFLSRIEIPTHILYSRDDPFFSPAVIPTEAELSARVTFELSLRGGHVAFVAGGNPLKPQYWMEQHLVEMLLTQSKIA